MSTASPVGFLITQVIASDPDEGTNGQVIYHLEPANDCFSVDAEMGAIYVSRFLRDEPDTCYDVIAVARDDGMPPL